MYTSLVRDEVKEIKSRVTRSSRWLVCILTLISAAGALQHVSADVGDWKRIGKAGEWKGTIALATMNDRLYTIDNSGALYVTDLAAGTWRQLGKAEFGKTRFLFAEGQSLYSIETDGSLYRVSPTNGAWSRVGQAGVWNNTIAGTMLNGRLYTVEQTGILYETIPATGVWKKLGNAEFAKSRFIFGEGSSLYTIEDGGLYRVNPTDGSWRLVGKAEDWTGTRAVAVLADQLYSANKSGALYKSSLETGQWVAVGKPAFGKTAFLFVVGYQLYSIESDGSLYAIETPRMVG
jgi:hypothetical protein